jgi:hypothetical protein
MLRGDQGPGPESAAVDGVTVSMRGPSARCSWLQGCGDEPGVPTPAGRQAVKEPVHRDLSTLRPGSLPSRPGPHRLPKSLNWAATRATALCSLTTLCKRRTGCADQAASRHTLGLAVSLIAWPLTAAKDCRQRTPGALGSRTSPARACWSRTYLIAADENVGHLVISSRNEERKNWVLAECVCEVSNYNPVC